MSTWAIAQKHDGSVYAAGAYLGAVDFDPGSSFAIINSGPTSSAYISKLSPRGIPRLSVTQPGGPGTSIFVDNTNLVPGDRYFNLLSLAPCNNGLGSGAIDTLGLCLTTPSSVQSIISQLMLPVGSPPFHISATSASLNWGPYTLPPGT